MGEKFNEEGINQKRKAKSGKRKLKRGVGTGPEARGDGKIKANGEKKRPTGLRSGGRTQRPRK